MTHGVNASALILIKGCVRRGVDRFRSRQGFGAGSLYVFDFIRYPAGHLCRVLSLSEPLG